MLQFLTTSAASSDRYIYLYLSASLRIPALCSLRLSLTGRYRSIDLISLALFVASPGITRSLRALNCFPLFPLGLRAERAGFTRFYTEHTTPTTRDHPLPFAHHLHTGIVFPVLRPVRVHFRAAPDVSSNIHGALPQFISDPGAACCTCGLSSPVSCL